MSVITNINQLDFSKKYSYTDYLKWKFEERIELIKGSLYKMSPAPSRKHQKLVGNIYGDFWTYLKSSKCEVYTAPFDVRLTQKGDKTSKTVLQPDICVICDLSKLDDKGCNGAPDLIVEVLSPGNTEKEMKLKYDVYEENGVKEYWVVQPEYDLVLVYILEDGKFVARHPLTASDELHCHIFPDLKVNLKEVFAD